MSKSDFGRIVAALRKEFRNEFDQIMTQNDLADLARMPLITLQKIEQGRQTNIKPEFALNLANAMNLASYCRQNFFLASLGLEDKDIINGKIPLNEILEELKSLLVQLQTPAFITNSFGDIMVANPLFFHILDIQPQSLNTGHMLCKLNINRIYYSPEFEVLHSMMGETYSAFARRRVFLFKALSLKYRNHWYFQKLLPELNRFPKFRQYWQSSTFHNEDIYILSNKFTLTHPRLGPMNFVSLPIQALSEETDLFLYSYQPLDNFTAKVCIQLSNELGTQPIKLARWIMPPLPDIKP